MLSGVRMNQRGEQVVTTLISIVLVLAFFAIVYYILMKRFSGVQWMKITLDQLLEYIIGFMVFIVLLNIVYSAFTSLYSKQTQQELILDKVNERLPFIERGTCRTVLFDIDAFNFVIFTPDHPRNSPVCSKGSPCGCV